MLKFAGLTIFLCGMSGIAWLLMNYVYNMFSSDDAGTNIKWHAIFQCYIAGWVCVGLIVPAHWVFSKFGLTWPHGPGETLITNILAFTKVGLIEEFCKLAGAICVIKLLKIKLETLRDAAIVMSAIAIGFASFENVLYLYADSTLIVRLFITPLAHLCFSLPMAFGLFYRKKAYYIASYMLAVFVHTAYNTSLVSFMFAEALVGAFGFGIVVDMAIGMVDLHRDEILDSGDEI